MDEDKLSVVGGQAVVNHQVHPLPKVPEPKVEDSRIALAPPLAIRNHLIHRQAGREAGRQGGRQAGRKAGREEGREGGRQGGRQGGMEGGREGR